MEEKGNFNYGWIIVGISFVTLALSYGVWHSFSIFFVALLKEFGWSRSIGAGAFSFFAIFHSITGFFAGGIVDRFGSRRIIPLGSLLLGVGLALSSFARTWWHFYFFFGVITAMGVGSTGWVPNTTIVQHWFKTRRGLAMGIISSGVGIGILICVPLVQHLINRVGWRMTYRIMAFFIPLIIAPMAVVFLKRRSQTISFRSNKKNTPYPTVEDPLIVDKKWVSRSWTVRQAITTKPFWLLCLCFLLASMMLQATLTHHVAFFVDQGLETLLASYIVGMVGIVSMGGKILWGTLSDRIGREIIYTIGMTCCICGMILLILFSFFHFYSLAYFYAIFFGMGYAVTAALPPLITADFYEGKAYGRIFGMIMILNGLGGAFGAWLSGLLHDQIGSYIPAFIILMACALFACLSLWRAAPRKIRIVPGKRGEKA